MNASKFNYILDGWIMCRRCFTISIRSPEALLMATITPSCLMVLFGMIFGSVADIGELKYIDFIVPGIILQSMGQASQHSAINVASDMAKGIMDRFRSMSISKSAVLIGHIGAGMMRSVISSAVIILTALMLGFRPKATVSDWIFIVLLLLLINLAVTVIAIMCGAISKSPEGASGLLFPLFILPFISSGFAPVNTMPGAVRWFAAIQPMTPMIDSIRALMLGLPSGNSLWLALGWCAALIIICYTVTLQKYTSKLL